VATIGFPIYVILLTWLSYLAVDAIRPSILAILGIPASDESRIVRWNGSETARRTAPILDIHDFRNVDS